MRPRLVCAALVGVAVLLAAPAASARPKARAPQTQPARATATGQAHRVVVHVTGTRQVPTVRLVFGRQAPEVKLRPLERDATRSLVEAVRRAPF
jgi:hypothetical protein